MISVQSPGPPGCCVVSEEVGRGRGGQRMRMDRMEVGETE